MAKPKTFSRLPYDFGLSKTIELKFDCMGFSQAQRCAALGFSSPTTYRNRISHPDNLTLGQLKGLSRLFGVEVWELLDKNKFVTQNK